MATTMPRAGRLCAGVCALAALLLCAVAASAAPAAPAFQDGFEAGRVGEWQPYGDGCRLEIAGDTQHGGRYSLRGAFDDSSGVAWANKGMQRRFTPGISWKSFRYLLFWYHLNRSATSLGCLLHDRAGNWWRAATPAPAAGRWSAAALPAAAFSWAWQDDPNILSGRKDSPIEEIFLFAGTERVNSGVRYTLALDDLALVSALPPGIGEPPVSAPPAQPLPAGEDLGAFPLQWKVTAMDRRGYLLVDGKPFFPLGLYSCLGTDQASGASAHSRYTGPVTEEKVHFWMRAIKDAGFNLLQSYTMQFYGAEVRRTAAGASEIVGSTTPEKVRAGWIRFMDTAHGHGLKVMAGCAPPYCAIRLPDDPAARAPALAAWKEQTRANIAAWRSHPALLTWYLCDEPSSVNFPVRDLVAQYRFLKALDDRHPFLIASCAVTDEQYRRGVDIIAPDPYPIESEVPLREMAARMRALARVQSGAPRMPQLWAVVQIAQWVEGRRLPSAEEIRLLSLLAISQGATGLLFYEFRNYADTDPAHWQTVGRAVRSLHSVIPSLLAEGEAIAVVSSDPRLYAMAKQVREPKRRRPALLLVTANPSQNLAREAIGLGEVTLSLSDPGLGEGAVATALDEDARGRFLPGGRRNVRVARQGKRLVLKDTFESAAAHVYRIAPAGK